MKDKILYEYSVIRIFPKVEREEFINAGILIYSKQEGRVLVKTFFNQDKFRAFESELDEDQILLNLKSFEKIANEHPAGGPIAALDPASRFRWMTAVRSSCIQTSPPHPGFSDNLDATLERLFSELVE